MKKAILLPIMLATVFAITGCRENKRAVMQNPNDKINITTTIFPAYDFVRQIAGDRVNLAMLLPPGAESHSFEPSPRDIIAIQNSDVFIYAGGESEKWVSRIIQSLNPQRRLPEFTDNMNILAMMDVVDKVKEETVEGMEEEHGEDENHEEYAYDEHVWTSPLNAILIVRSITELLCRADNTNAGFYRQNSASCLEALEELDATFKAVVAGAKRNTIVFADRFPFRYLADAYGLKYFAAFPGCSTEAEPSAATVAFLINKIKTEKIPVVFHIELSNERMADTISGETGAKKLLLHSCHNITKQDFDSGEGYIDIMRRNVENLREALN